MSSDPRVLRPLSFIEQAELQKENAILKAQLKGAAEQAILTHERVLRDVVNPAMEKKDAELAKLKTAFVKYRHHLIGCSVVDDIARICSCGMDKVL